MIPPYWAQMVLSSRIQSGIMTDRLSSMTTRWIHCRPWRAVDFHAWEASVGIEVDANGGFAIILKHVKKTLPYQKTTIQPGDILIFRSGWLNWFKATADQERYTELCERNDPGVIALPGWLKKRTLLRGFGPSRSRLLLAMRSHLSVHHRLPRVSVGFTNTYLEL